VESEGPMHIETIEVELRVDDLSPLCEQIYEGPLVDRKLICISVRCPGPCRPRGKTLDHGFRVPAACECTEALDASR